MLGLNDRTREDDEIGALGADDAVDEGGGVEIGAGGGLVGEDVEAARRSAVSVVHVRHLQNLELTPPPSTEAEAAGRRRSTTFPSSLKSRSLFSGIHGDIGSSGGED